jgi:hypothetical protein
LRAAAQVAALASAYATLRHPDPALLSALSGVATRADVVRTMRSSEAAAILQAFRTLGCLNEALATCLRPVAAGVAGGGRAVARAGAGVGTATQALCEAAASSVSSLARSDAAGELAVERPRGDAQRAAV